MIKNVHVENFRAISDGRLENLSDFFALAGRNGAGKSNFLQALNLFFNSEIESGVPLDLRRDFHRREQRKKKRRIRVEIDFALPESFTFHKAVAEKANELGLTSAPLSIARHWELEAGTQTVIDRYEIAKDDTWLPVEPDLLPVLTTFLTRLIRYRYVPNHIHPSTLVEGEADNVRREVLARLKGKTREKTEEAFKTMASVAEKLIEESVTIIRKAAPELHDAVLATPESITDVAFPLTIALQTRDDIARDTRVHGSGHQSLLSYSLLHLVDSSFQSKFGWHQGTIWGIEEPESFLHEELALGLGRMLRAFVDDDRFQILATTHSPTIMAFCRFGAVVAEGRAKTLLPAELVPEATRAGAAPFVHSLLRGATRPLLVVEGSTDVTHLLNAYRVLNRPNPWEIRSLDEFSVAAGDSGMKQLIKYHGEVVAARPPESPVVALLDHNVNHNSIKAHDAKIRERHATSTVLQWLASCANPDLNMSTFTGIEAFLSTSALEGAQASKFVTLLRPSSGTPIAVDRATFDKAGLADHLSALSNPEHYKHFAPVLEYIESHLTAAPQLVAG